MANAIHHAGIDRRKFIVGTAALAGSRILPAFAAGAYKVGLNGLGYLNCSAVKTHGDQSECDHTSCVDAISLKRVCEDLAETPAIDDETRPALKLAAGTRLVLDYPGTMKVSSLTLDGVRVPNGVISAADYPEFLSGRGKLELAPNRGLVIVVK